jgi:hypothetical protein
MTPSSPNPSDPLGAPQPRRRLKATYWVAVPIGSGRVHRLAIMLLAPAAVSCQSRAVADTAASLDSASPASATSVFATVVEHRAESTRAIPARVRRAPCSVAAISRFTIHATTRLASFRHVEIARGEILLLGTGEDEVFAAVPTRQLNVRARRHTSAINLVRLHVNRARARL